MHTTALLPRPLAGWPRFWKPIPPSCRLALLDRGFVLAVAHVRGGGHAGSVWHEAGRLQHKTNGAWDLIACAQQLVAEGLVDPGRLCVEAESAGACVRPVQRQGLLLEEGIGT